MLSDDMVNDASATKVDCSEHCLATRVQNSVSLPMGYWLSDELGPILSSNRKPFWITLAGTAIFGP